MSLRRIVGCAVMASLLASVALPAMCGACMDFAPKRGCGEKHDARPSASGQLSMAMGVHCGDCGERPGIAAKQTGRLARVSEFVFLDCPRRICVPAEEQNATINRDRVEANRKVADGATVSASTAGPTPRTIHQNVFGKGKKSLGNSGYQPLSVSLKI